MGGNNEGVTITHERRGTGGKYIASVPGESEVGYLDWEPAGEGLRVATHTIVPPAIGGRGIAALLVQQLMADARDQGFKVIPQCWYVAKKFDENPSWENLRA